jgi:hypothetical protein
VVRVALTVHLMRFTFPAELFCQDGSVVEQPRKRSGLVVEEKSLALRTKQNARVAQW